MFNSSDVDRHTTQLKEMIQSNELEFLMVDRNWITTKIIDKTSRRTKRASAQFGARDSNEGWNKVIQT